MILCMGGWVVRLVVFDYECYCVVDFVWFEVGGVCGFLVVEIGVMVGY